MGMDMPLIDAMKQMNDDKTGTPLNMDPIDMLIQFHYLKEMRIQTWFKTTVINI